MPQLTRTVRIGSAHGLHARPAKMFAQAAKDSGIPVTVAKDAGAPINAASILGVIALGVEQGDYVTLDRRRRRRGDGARQACRAPHHRPRRSVRSREKEDGRWQS